MNPPVWEVQAFCLSGGKMGKPDEKARSTAEKLALFRSCFSGLSDVYGTYDLSSGRASQVKAPVTDRVILAHLTGRKPYGVYLLVKDRTRAIAVDFDTPDRLPPSEFVARAQHYGLSAYIERSKSKGYHVWIFFDENGVPARKARLVVQHILEEIEQPQTEVFPKQDRLEDRVRYGNFINAPLFGPLVLEGKTAFVGPRDFQPFPDQWEFLESVERSDEHALDDILAINALSAPTEVPYPSDVSDKNGKGSFTLPPCAVRMLQDGVSEFQRVGCFRLAVHLKRVGLPYDLAVAALKTWALKNRPAHGKGVIRDDEIVSQVSCAYKGTYLGYGCESPSVQPYCADNCPVLKWRTEGGAESGKKHFHQNPGRRQSNEC